MASLQSSRFSNLPVLVRDKAMATRGSNRRALGDITSQQSNQPIAVADKVAAKPRLTKQASRRLSKPAPVPEVEEMEVEAKLERVFPPGVEDVDSRDDDNPLMCSEYAFEIFSYLRNLESRTAVRAGHLQGCPTNDKMRAVLVDWLVEVQLQFKLLQETLFITVDIVDRYLAIEGKTVSRGRLQLVGVSAMFLAAKIEEVYAPACSDFVYITDDAYSESEIKATEMKILRALKFDLFQPVSLHFLRRFSKVGDVDRLQHTVAKYALEVALLDYSLVPTPGSELAAAALLLALLLAQPQDSSASVWSPTLAYYSGYSRDHLLPTTARLAAAIARITKNTKLQAVRTKYKAAKFLKVADLPDLKGEVLTKLAGLQY